VVINQKVSYADLRRLAVHVHTALGRAIQPFQTPHDGDTLFAVTTAEVPNPRLTLIDLCTHAAELSWDAVLSSVPRP
jgi:L-aminopeptidase/D-esterase-like protein